MKCNEAVQKGFPVFANHCTCNATSLITHDHDGDCAALLLFYCADDLLHAKREIRALRSRIAAENETCATVALEQRCERGTDWDRACLVIAEAIRARAFPNVAKEKDK